MQSLQGCSQFRCLLIWKLWRRNRHSISGNPALFIWGMKDPVIKPRYLDKFASGFPEAQVARMESCGHFPQEEQPETAAALIAKFMSGR